MTERPILSGNNNENPLNKKSILIVEDEAIVAADLQATLERLGYHVCGVHTSGKNAIEGVKNNQPDLVLMDIHLAGKMDGIETTEKINEDFNIPVIYLTAMADDHTLQRAKITTPFGYILKPFEIDNLHSTIEMALYKHSLDHQLRLSEERYRNLFDYSPVPLIELDLSSVKKYMELMGSANPENLQQIMSEHWQEVLEAARQIKINFFNQAMMEVTQIKNIEDYYQLIEKNIISTRLAEYFELANTYLKPSFANKGIEISHSRLDGSQFRAIMKTSVLPGSENTWDRVIYSLYDISERVRTEEALKHRLKVEELVSNISSRFVHIPLEQLDDEINHTLKMLGEFSVVNTSYVRLFENDGITLGRCYEWCAKKAPSLKDPLTGMSHEPFKWLNERLNRGDYIYLLDTSQAPDEAGPEKEIWKRYDIESILQIPLVIQQRTAGFMGFNRDKSQPALDQSDIKLYRMVAEIISNALERKQTEEVYHILVDHASIELLILQDNRVIFANRAACVDNDIEMREIQGRTFDELLEYTHPEDRQKLQDVYQQVCLGNKNIPPFEMRTLLDKGKTRWLESSITPIEYLGKPAQQITQIDITDSKIAQQELERSETRLQAFFDRAGIGIAICNMQNKILMANPQFEKMVGYSIDELLSMNCSDITHPADVTEENNVIESLLSGETNRSQIEKRLVCKNGSTIWGRLTLTLIHYSNLNEQLLVKMVEDITERKAAEEALQASEERLRLVLEGSRDGFWDWDILSGEVIYSPRWAEMRGFKLEEVSPDLMSWESMIHPDDLPIVHQMLQQHLERHKPQFESEYRIMTKFGEWKWILDRGVALFNDEGIAVRMTGTQTDNTERKQMEVALRESEARFRAIYDNSGVGIALTDKSGDILLSNPAFQKMLGYSPAELQNMTFYDITHPEDVRPNQELTWALHAKKIEGFQLTKRYIRSNSEIMWGHVTVTPVKDDGGNILFVIGMIEDITEQKKAEEALKESEEKLRGLIKESRDGIIIVDEMGIVIEWNHAIEEITRTKSKDVTGRPLWEVQQQLQLDVGNQKASYENTIKSIRAAVANGQATWMNKLIDIRINTSEETPVYLQAIIFPVRTSKGYMVCIISRDVTEAKKFEQKLRLGKEEWEATVNALTEMIILTDSSGTILRTNRSAQQLFIPYDVPVVGENIDLLFKPFTGDKKLSHLKGEHFFEDSGYWFLVTSYTLHVDEKASGMVYVIKDISKQKEVEAALIASQKLNSLGTLVAGLAHEMNSPLQVIISTSESLLKELLQKEELDREHLQNYLDMIHRNAWRNAEIVRSLRLYTESSVDNIEHLDVNDLVNDVLLLLQNRIGSDASISVSTNLGSSLPKLPFNRNKLSQVLINLLINAIDAIDENGEIKISTRYQPDRDSIVLQVQDNGSGIPEDIQPKIFDPFFTTKPVGSGLGLGLSTVLGIINGCGGEIGLESAPNKGTTFTLYLPLEPKTGQSSDDIRPEDGRYDDSVME